MLKTPETLISLCFLLHSSVNAGDCDNEAEMQQILSFIFLKYFMKYKEKWGKSQESTAYYTSPSKVKEKKIPALSVRPSALTQ